MRIRFLPLLLGALAPWCEAQTQKTDSFLRPNDVIALVGGEDMVAADEYGYLELLLQQALPKHHLKVRCLAWEGDTVFEQRRMLNYPSLEQQLNDIGATVVIMQFGQMESLAGASKLQEFTSAYGRLMGLVTRTDQRRLAIVAPTPFHLPGSLQSERADTSWAEYTKAIKSSPDTLIGFTDHSSQPQSLRDGVHLDRAGHLALAAITLRTILPEASSSLKLPAGFDSLPQSANASKGDSRLLDLIRAKNRLWNNYRRPQNWAFLAGDRTEQPSSRDHIDRNKRWFPEEMKQWLPLIDAKETEIWKLAAELAGK